MGVVLLTTGVPGCGKTYVRAARFLVDDFLVNSDGIHYSNFPLSREIIAQDVSSSLSRSFGFFSFLSRKQKKVSEDDLLARLHIIPDEVLLSWSREESGPWEYFKNCDLRYAHIAIDEIHNYISYGKSSAYLQKWDEFLGEIRHRGCTFEGLTQDESQVHPILLGRCALRLELIPAEDLRDPFFRIKMSDWYELKASFSGCYHKTVFEFEKRKQGRVFKVNHCRRFLILPDYFKYYNSFNASLSEKSEGVSDEGRGLQYEYQRRSRLSLLFWFLRRNFFNLSWRLLLVAVIIWLCFFGGMNFFLSRWLDTASSINQSNQSKLQQHQKSVEVSSLQYDPGEGGQFIFSTAKDAQEAQIIKKIVFDSYKPSMFFDNKVFLRNSLSVEVGYVFDENSPYSGKKIVSIDKENRCYKLDNGVTVTMF